MFVLIAGLIIFLGVHSVRIFADSWRSKTIARIGQGRWMALYTFNSLIGLGLIIWGYGLARDIPIAVWQPPLWTRHVTILLVAAAFFLLAQSRSPQGPVSAWIGHPMTAGVGIWAFAHLIANGTLADILLFGSFLVWSILAFAAAASRDRKAGEKHHSAGWMADLKPGIIGLAIWAVFLWKAHEWLFGISPLG